MKELYNRQRAWHSQPRSISHAGMHPAFPLDNACTQHLTACMHTAFPPNRGAPYRSPPPRYHHSTDTTERGVNEVRESGSLVFIDWLPTSNWTYFMAGKQGWVRSSQGSVGFLLGARVLQLFTEHHALMKNLIHCKISPPVLNSEFSPNVK
jgi:hypothetical protein